MKKFSPSVLFVILSIVSFSASAQSERDTLFADTNYQMGDSLMKAGKYDESQEYVLIAAEIFEKNKQWSKLVDALNVLSEDNWRLGKLDEADRFASKAQNVSQSYLGESHLMEADALNNLGNVKIMRGMLSESLVDHEEGLRIKKLRLDEDDPVLAGSYSNIGVIYDYLGDYDQALYYYEKALKIDEKVLGGKHADIAMSYNNIGSIYEFKGDARTALEYYEKALQVDIEVLGGDHPDLADIYSNIGTIHYYNGSFELAGDYYQKGLRIRTNSFESNHPKLADSYNNVGTVLFERDDFDGALENYLKALKIREEALGPKHSKVVSVFHNIASLYNEIGETATSIAYYKQALEISEQSLTPNHPDIATSHAHIGRIYREVGQLDLALFHLQEALRIYKTSFGERHPDIGRTYNSIGVVYNKKNQFDDAMKNIDLGLLANSDSGGLMSQGYSQYYFLNSLKSKAETFYLKFLKGNQLTDLKGSLDNFLKCDTLIATMRNANLRYEDKLSLGLTASNIYPLAAEVSQLLFEKTGDTLYPNLSFYFSERNKSVALSQSLLDQYAKGYSGIPDSLLREERTLLIDGSFYRSEILKMKLKTEGYDSGRMDKFENRLFMIKRKADSLIKSYENTFPKYHKLKYADTILSIEEIQEELLPHQVLIEYLESDSSVFIFSIVRDDFWVKAFPRNSDYDSIIDAYLNSLDYELINDSPEEAFQQYTLSANRIHQMLLEPAIKGLKPGITQLMIIPDGKLSYAPWDILLTDAPEEFGYKSLKYLIKDYSISYAHSASSLFHQIQTLQSPSKSTLAFAPSYQELISDETRKGLLSEFRDELVPLVWNESEIRAIEEYFPGNYFVGDLATEERFKQAADDYQILHLAMHAFVDNQSPMLSKFVFTQNQDSIDDGMLHAYELFNMNLSAELAVLSACKTGIGKIEKGEGVMSLGRAFSYAGCQSVMMSHWSVDDKSTSSLMNSFYKYLANGESKDQAIRKAKLDFIEATHGVQTHPYYWGGFVVLGNSDALSSQKSSWLLIIISVVGLIAVGSGVYVKFRA